MLSSEGNDLSHIQQKTKEEEETERESKEDSFLVLKKELEKEEIEEKDVIYLAQKPDSPEQFKSSKTFPMKEEKRVHFEIDYEDFESEASVSQEEISGSKIIPIVKKKKLKGRVRMKKSATLPKKSQFSPTQDSAQMELMRIKSEQVLQQQRNKSKFKETEITLKTREQRKTPEIRTPEIIKTPDNSDIIVQPEKNQGLLKVHTFQMNESSDIQEQSEKGNDSRIDTPRFQNVTKSSAKQSRFKGTPSEQEINSEVQEIVEEMIEEILKPESQEWPAGFVEVFDEVKQGSSYEKKQIKKPKLLEIEESKNETDQHEAEEEKETHGTKIKSENETSADDFHFSLLKKLPTNNSLEKQRTEQALGKIIAANQIQLKPTALLSDNQDVNKMEEQVKSSEKEVSRMEVPKNEILIKDSLRSSEDEKLQDSKNIAVASVEDKNSRIQEGHEPEQLYPSEIILKTKRTPKDERIDAKDKVKKGNKREIPKQKKAKQAACCGNHKCLIF